MCVRAVEGQNLTPNAPHVIRAKSPLNLAAIETSLSDHPDKEFVSKILTYIKQGVPIGYEGPRETRVSKNWPSAKLYAAAVEASLAKDLSKGRKAGPFMFPPFSTFVGSPMGAFPKKRSVNKYRVIHDLSWPPGHSVNDFITEDCSLEYINMDTIAKLVKQSGTGSLLAKLDLEDAYKHILVRPQDWDLLGSTWLETDKNGVGHIVYYVDTVLPFGLRSAPKLFDLFATALEYGMSRNGVSIVAHYLDDFFTCGSKDSTECHTNLKSMLDTCDQFGFAVQPSKVVGPCTEMEYLGILVDSVNMQLRISNDRLSEIIEELKNWRYKYSCTKRQLLSVVGKLTFISRVVRPGRTFVRRMINLSKRVKHLHHHIRINSECRSDIKWWLEFLPSWNGISMFYEDNWSNNIDLELWTDASDIGAGAYFQGKWIMLPFTGKYEYCVSKSIAWRELFAIVIAIVTWGDQLKSKRVQFHCDNLTIVQILQKGTSPVCDLMVLVRALFYICAKHNLECTAVHIEGIRNNIADALSRLRLDTFKSLVPDSEETPTIPLDIPFM